MKFEEGMTRPQGFVLHPLAAKDITEIWRYIANDNAQAARRVRQDILDAIRGLVSFPQQGPPSSLCSSSGLLDCVRAG